MVGRVRRTWGEEEANGQQGHGNHRLCGERAAIVPQPPHHPQQQEWQPPVEQREPAHEQRDARLEHRSEEHTSELQSLAYLVCRLLLEKKKKIIHTYIFLIIRIINTI